MSCKNFSGLLSAYIDSELPGNDMLMVRDHLRTCTACQFEAERLGALKHSLGGLHMFEPPVGLESRLKQAVFSAPRVSRNTWTFIGLLAASSVAGAFLAIHLADRPAVPDKPIAQHRTTQDLQVAADRAYLGGSDPISGGVSVVSVNYAGGH